MATASELARRERRFELAGRTFRLQSNSDCVFDMVHRLLPCSGTPEDSAVAFDLAIDVDPSFGPSMVVSKPYFRGRDHLIFGALDENSSLLFDLRERCAMGVISSGVAADDRLWRDVVLPLILGLTSPVIGVAPLHAACLVRHGEGTLIAGASGAGKSTLALALAQAGMEFLSDDWTFLSTASDGTLRLHASSVSMKLLPDTSRFFPSLNRFGLTESLNGEISYQVDASHDLRLPRAWSCRPARIVMLERRPGALFEVSAAGKDEVIAHFRGALDTVPKFLIPEREKQFELIEQLAGIECIHIACDGTPQQIAENVLEFLDSADRSIGPSDRCRQLASPEYPDLMGRLRPTPLLCDAAIGDLAVSVETNDPVVLAQFFNRSQARNGTPSFLCTVVVEDRFPVGSSFRRVLLGSHAISALGDHGFIAADPANQRLIAFVSHEIARSGRLMSELAALLQSSPRAAVVAANV
jgi:hypothetical protein